MPRPLHHLRATVSAALFLLLALVCAAPAAAHTRLRSSSPANHATVGDTLKSIELQFTEAVAYGTASVELRLGDSVVARGTMSSEPGREGKSVRYDLPHPLAPGDYVAGWRAASEDGHVVRGTLAFTVVAMPKPVATAATAAPQTEAAAQQQPAADEAASGDEEAESDAAKPLPVSVRWAEFLALLGMIGAVAFNLFVVRRVRGGEMAPVAERASRGAWRLGLVAAVLSLLTLLARLWLQSVELNGAADAFDAEMLRGLLTATVWGSGWILQAVGTVAFLLGLLVARAPHGRSVGWMGASVAALLLAAVPALSGHAAAEERLTALAIASDWLHVLGAGVWLGTLAAVMLAGLPAAASAPGGQATAAFARIVAAFSPVALAGAGLAGATGVVSSLFHITAVHELWSTPYGVMLLVKLGLLAIVAGIGFYNWRFVLPTLHASESPSRLRRTAGAELMTGLMVVLVTAILVALPPP